ncbi:MAG: hypothetical protein PHR39_00905 [Actinomycetota bacterium]|nr:hypothetical protein [Actinomycetota bacterium]
MYVKKTWSEKKRGIYLGIAAVLVTCLIVGTGCFYSKSDKNLSKDTENKDPVSTVSSTSSLKTVSENETDNDIATSEEEETAICANDNELKNEFEEIQNSKAGLIKIIEFLEKNISCASRSLADEMMYFTVREAANELEDFTDNYADSDIQNIIFDEFEGSTDLNLLKTSKNKKLADLAQSTIDRKYKLFSLEGFITPFVDYKAYGLYRQYISEEMNDYMDIMQAESDMPSAVDAGIAVPMEEFIDRIIKSYEFIAEYPDSPRAEQINDMKNRKVWIYFAGIDNTPVFDTKGNVYHERLKDFRDMEKKYEGTEFGNQIKEYLDLLILENYKKTQKITDYLDKIFNL